MEMEIEEILKQPHVLYTDNKVVDYSYVKVTYEWNHRDSDELCGYDRKERRVTEKAVKVVFSGAALVVSQKPEDEKGFWSNHVIRDEPFAESELRLWIRERVFQTLKYKFNMSESDLAVSLSCIEEFENGCMEQVYAHITKTRLLDKSNPNLTSEYLAMLKSWVKVIVNSEEFTCFDLPYKKAAEDFLARSSETNFDNRFDYQSLIYLLQKEVVLARELFKRQLAGEVLVNFTAWHRRGGMTKLGDGWVIRADGTFRKHDTDNVRKSDGTYRWYLVQPDELAIVWSLGSKKDIAMSNFYVAHMPVSGLTQEQLNAVKDVESEIEAPEGVFGLDPEVLDLQAKHAEACREAAMRVWGDNIEEFSYLQIISDGGFFIGYDHFFPIDLVNVKTVSAASREATVLKEIEVLEGILEFLEYHKYSDNNVVIRWREFSPEELENRAAKNFSDQSQKNTLADLAEAWGAKLKR